MLVLSEQKSKTHRFSVNYCRRLKQQIFILEKLRPRNAAVSVRNVSFLFCCVLSITASWGKCRSAGAFTSCCVHRELDFTVSHSVKSQHVCGRPGCCYWIYGANRTWIVNEDGGQSLSDPVSRVGTFALLWEGGGCVYHRFDPNVIVTKAVAAKWCHNVYLYTSFRYRTAWKQTPTCRQTSHSGLQVYIHVSLWVCADFNSLLGISGGFTLNADCLNVHKVNVPRGQRVEGGRWKFSHSFIFVSPRRLKAVE